MLIRLPNYYVGLLDGAPAHVAFSKDSITLELFRDPKAAKRKFSEIARTNIVPYITVVNYGPFEYENLAGKIFQLEKQLADLKQLRRAWWITEKATRLMQITRDTFRKLFMKKDKNG
jgi:hypothetical protein